MLLYKNGNLIFKKKKQTQNIRACNKLGEKNQSELPEYYDLHDSIHIYIYI